MLLLPISNPHIVRPLYHD